jgi:hypothetical protein
MRYILRRADVLVGKKSTMIVQILRSSGETSRKSSSCETVSVTGHAEKSKVVRKRNAK